MSQPAKPLAASFLGGAKSRLLPASIPFRYFGGAVIFHLAFWLALAWAAPEVPNFVAGPGRVLAALHLLTLGVFAPVALGAAFQLLPVATKQPLAALWPARLAAWLLFPGVVLFAIGTAETIHWTSGLGAAAILAALLLGVGLLAVNLWRARGMVAVVAHGWAAVASLATLAALGFLLVIDQYHGVIGNRMAVALVHAVLGMFGFMGLLALGFSYVLVPMFALSPAPSPRLALASLALAIAALALAIAGAFGGHHLLLFAAVLLALGAVALHLWLMAQTMKTRMRKKLGPSFVMVRCAWVALPVALAMGGALALDLGPPRGTALFGVLALIGWLLTFLAAMWQRIIPFLASMHAAAPGRAPPLVSALTSQWPLALHRLCHAAALAALLIGIGADWPDVVRAGAALGALGAAAFAWFLVNAMRRMRRDSAVSAPA